MVKSSRLSTAHCRGIVLNEFHAIFKFYDVAIIHPTFAFIYIIYAYSKVYSTHNMYVLRVYCIRVLLRRTLYVINLYRYRYCNDCNVQYTFLYIETNYTYTARSTCQFAVFVATTAVTYFHCTAGFR